MKGGHIITCLNLIEYDKFIKNGFAGLYPIKVVADRLGNNRSLAAKIGTNWDIIADLKRVKIGDYIFLHTKGEGFIYGPFEATTTFKESNDMIDPFKSENLTIEYWQENYEDLEINEYPWRVGIKSIDNITKTGGFSAMELFKLKSIGIMQSLPERFIYHDKPKIVKPLLNNEVEKILELLNYESPFLNVTAQDLSLYNEIKLNLKSYGGELFREKILEAWFMENATFNGDNLAKNEIFNQIFGKKKYFANSIYTYYANFLDVLFYNETAIDIQKNEYCGECGSYISKNKTDIWIIELKKGWCNDGVINQLNEYGDWAKKALANNNAKRLNLCIVGTGFSENLLLQKEIKLVKYSFIDMEPFLILEKINF